MTVAKGPPMFNVGDVVVLRSGIYEKTVFLTVSKPGADRTECVWFNERLNQRVGTFPNAALIDVPPELTLVK